MTRMHKINLKLNIFLPMKNAFQLLMLFFFFTITGYAQHDSTRYANGLPVSQDDTVQQFPQRDLNPVNELIRTEKREVPKKIIKRLQKDKLYEGWEKVPIYFDKNTKLYVIHIPSGNTSRTYHFNE